MASDLSDEELKAQSIELAKRLLNEVDQDYKKALYLACALHTNCKNEISVGLDQVKLMITMNQPTKRRRGRPRKINLNENSGLSPKAKSKKRIGAPKKYLPDIPNWGLAIRIANIAEKSQISFAQAARIELERHELQRERAFVKTLAEEAKRYSEERRQLLQNMLLNFKF